MLTINNILKEIKNVPVNRLNEVYQFVHSLTTETHIKEKKKQKNEIDKINSIAK